MLETDPNNLVDFSKISGKRLNFDNSRRQNLAS